MNSKGGGRHSSGQIRAARGAQPEEEERTDGELNWRKRADSANEVAAQKHRA